MGNMRPSRIPYFLLVICITFAQPVFADNEAFETSFAKVTALSNAGRYDDALQLARKFVDKVRQQHGEQHPRYGLATLSLAHIIFGQGHLAEAEKLYRRSLAIFEKSFGSESATVGSVLSDLSVAISGQARYIEAEQILKRALTIQEAKLDSDDKSIGTTLLRQGELYGYLGRTTETESVLKRALAIYESKLGPEDSLTANCLNSLGSFYRYVGRFAEAEPLLLRTLKIRQKNLGLEHPDTATALGALAALRKEQGQYDNAQDLLKRALAIREKVQGPDHPDIATALNNLALIYQNQGRYQDVEKLYRRAVAISEKALGPQNPVLALQIGNLGLFLQEQGRYHEAEPLLKQALAVRESALGPDHPETALSLNNLAQLQYMTGRYENAENLYRRAIAILEKSVGLEHPWTANLLDHLGKLQLASGNNIEAMKLFWRSIHISKKVLGPEHVNVAVSMASLAEVARNIGELKDAEQLLGRAIEILSRKLGNDHVHVNAARNGLALILAEQGHYEDAIRLLEQVFYADQQSLGDNHPNHSRTINNIADIYRRQGKYKEAARDYNLAIEASKKTFGSDNPRTIQITSNLGSLWFDQKHWPLAGHYFDEAHKANVRRARKLDNNLGRGPSAKKDHFSLTAQDNSIALMKSLSRIKDFADGKTGEMRRKASLFELAQWSVASDAAAALSQMTVRLAAKGGSLSALVRERQDLVGEWRSLEKHLTSEQSQPADQRKKDAETRMISRMEEIDTRIGEIDKKLERDFPQYSAFAKPAPLSIVQTQRLIRKDEALILLLDAPEMQATPAETFVFAVTRDKAEWRRVKLGGKELSDRIALLRMALDPENNERSVEDKRGLVASQPPNTGFDLTVAHELYEKLLSPIDDVISGKSHLMVVASGPLTALPLQVFVKSAPDVNLQNTDRYQRADWLVRHFAITTLPSVASLKALRDISERAESTKQFPLIGFADPKFRPETGIAPQRIEGSVRQAENRSYAEYFRGIRSDLVALQHLPALPGTRRELERVGTILNAEKTSMFFGRAATERAVKSAPLDRYRIVYFATHGLVAGDVDDLAEPALALSVPKAATEEDDGLLTSSEVAALHLNADWVVMSACNTAAGDKPGAEALSGLARAFFYSGARTLLVSHWPVDDDAAVRLTTHAFKAIEGAFKEGRKLGKSEALREAMLAMIDAGAANANPTLWAPFVIVGEGAER